MRPADKPRGTLMSTPYEPVFRFWGELPDRLASKSMIVTGASRNLNSRGPTVSVLPTAGQILDREWRAPFSTIFKTLAFWKASGEALRAGFSGVSLRKVMVGRSGDGGWSWDIWSCAGRLDSWRSPMGNPKSRPSSRRQAVWRNHLWLSVDTLALAKIDLAKHFFFGDFLDFYHLMLYLTTLQS